MGVLNQHKWTIIAATLLMVYKSYSLVMTLTFMWSFLEMSLKRGFFTGGYFKTFDYIYFTNLATTLLALVVQVIFDLIILVGLLKKKSNDVKVGLMPSAICLTIECLAFVVYFTNFVVELGFQYFDLKMVLFIIVDVSLELASAFVLLMIRKYYLKMRYQANIQQDAANVKQVKPEFKVLI